MWLRYCVTFYCSHVATYENILLWSYFQDNIPIPNTHQYHHLLQFCSMIMFFTLSSVHASLKEFLEEEFECAICLESCTDTLVNPECNHRFCGKCIKESLHKCNHECPTCRVHIPTYRTCCRDPQFDHIVSTETK